MIFSTTIQFENNVMSTAWSIAKEALNHFQIGKVKDYFSSALKMAWAMFKALKNVVVENKEANELLSKYIGKSSFITLVSKNQVYERMNEIRKYKGKDIKRNDLFVEKVENGYKLESVTLSVTGGKYLHKIALKKDNDSIFALDEMDQKYISWLIRRQ